MKTKLPLLRVGDEVLATVVEVLAGGDVLCSFEGDLLRVRNQTTWRPRLRDVAPLVVISKDPLEFRWQGAHRRGLDRFV